MIRRMMSDLGRMKRVRFSHMNPPVRTLSTLQASPPPLEIRVLGKDDIPATTKLLGDVFAAHEPMGAHLGEERNI